MPSRRHTPFQQIPRLLDLLTANPSAPRVQSRHRDALLFHHMQKVWGMPRMLSRKADEPQGETDPSLWRPHASSTSAPLSCREACSQPCTLLRCHHDPKMPESSNLRRLFQVDIAASPKKARVRRENIQGTSSYCPISSVVSNDCTISLSLAIMRLLILSTTLRSTPYADATSSGDSPSTARRRNICFER